MAVNQQGTGAAAPPHQPPISDARADQLAVLLIFAGCVAGTLYAYVFGRTAWPTVEVVDPTPGNPFNTIAHALLCALVYLWAIELYGRVAALGAVGAAVAAPSLLAAAQYVPSDLGYAACYFGVVYAQARNALDPSVQSVLVAAAAVAVACALGTPWQPLVAVVAAIPVVRVLAAEPGERRLRVVHGAVVAVLGSTLLGAGIAHLGAALWPAAAPAEPQARGPGLGFLPPVGRLTPRIHTVVDVRHLPTLLLAFGPSWPWHRRYGDGVIAAAVVLGGLLFGFRDTGDATLLPVVPFVALLAGRAWDPHRSAAERRFATVFLLAQALIVLLTPHFVEPFLEP